MPIEENELIRKLIQRRSMVIAYVRSIVFDADLAEDVFQDVVLVALKKREQLESTENVSAWFRKIARFEALNALRKRQRRPLLFDDRLLDLVDATWNNLDSNHDEDRVAAIQHCVERLPQKSKKILDLKYKRGLSGQEMAKELNQPLNTVYITFTRIHSKLRECTQRYFQRQHHIK